MDIGLLQCVFLIFLSARQHNAVMVQRVPCCFSKLAVHWSESTTGDTDYARLPHISLLPITWSISLREGCVCGWGNRTRLVSGKNVENEQMCGKEKQKKQQNTKTARQYQVSCPLSASCIVIISLLLSSWWWQVTAQHQPQQEFLIEMLLSDHGMRMSGSVPPATVPPGSVWCTYPQVIWVWSVQFKYNTRNK